MWRNQHPRYGAFDAGNTETYGHPVPTKVPLGHKKGKAILVSGHDLIDLEELLKQTQGKNIKSTPMEKCFQPMVIRNSKNYATFMVTTAQHGLINKKNSAHFPGAILMTTNCIQKPIENYKGTIFSLPVQ